MSPFFVFFFTCGYVNCGPPTVVDFKDVESCVQFVEQLSPYMKQGLAGTCFDRSTGKIVAMTKKPEEKKW